jgi:rhodanese-related sulfurtransferase
VPEISPADAKRLIDSGAQLIDVRTDAEYEAGHIPGSRHIPLADVQPQAAGLEHDQPLIIYCRSGDRSGLAADAFAASGWDAHSITGGLEAWKEEGLPLEPADGVVAHASGLPPA